MMIFLDLKVQNFQCIFSIGSVSPSPCHCLLGSVSTCMITFLHFKVHNANANSSLAQFPHHHFIIGSVSTFKHDDVSVPKTFMPAHSCMMTFLHLKVHND